MHMSMTNNPSNNHNTYFDIQTPSSYRKYESNINQTPQLEYFHPKHIFISKNPQKIYISTSIRRPLLMIAIILMC